MSWSLWSGLWRGAIPVGAALLSLAWAPESRAASTPLSNAGPVLEEIAKQAQDRTRSEAERLQLVGLLGGWGSAEVIPPLIAVLDDPVVSIRTAAARALAWKGNQAALPALKERLGAPGEVSGVRVAVVEAIGRIGDDSARPLVLATARDADAGVRGAALYALTFENLRSPSDRIPLLREMAGDRSLDPYLRTQAIQALGEEKDLGSAETLLRLVRDEPAFAMPKLTSAPSERELMAIRFRQARNVKAWAVRVLTLLDVKAAIPLALKNADEPQDYFLRVTSLQALGAWKVKEGLAILIRRLEDPFAPARQAAVWALGELRDRSAVDPLLARLADRSTEVRVQAVDTLGLLGDQKVRPHLEALRQRDGEAQVQDAVNRALARLPR